jgi:hypothetical protein
MIEKNLTYYMGLPYRVEFYPEEGESFQREDGEASE